MACLELKDKETLLGSEELTQFCKRHLAPFKAPKKLSLWIHCLEMNVEK
ncbi:MULTISPECIES: hypothetical protein [Bacillus]|nr:MULTISPECIES: hypothetical protein [Bacillus]